MWIDIDRINRVAYSPARKEFKGLKKNLGLQFVQAAYGHGVGLQVEPLLRLLSVYDISKILKNFVHLQRGSQRAIL